MGDYCLKENVQAQQWEPGQPDLAKVEALIPAASRWIDRACRVADGYFDAAAAAATNRTFYGNGTSHLYVGPHNSTIVATNVAFVDTSITVPDFTERPNRSSLLVWLVADEGEEVWRKNKPLIISAKWGFAAIPEEIKLACIELVLAQFRTLDPARERGIADASGVEFRIAKIPARVKEICEQWRRLQPIQMA